MTTYDLYVRMSEADDEQGIDRQLLECRAWLAERGAEEGDVYSDNDISATKGKIRPGFQAILSRPKATARRPILTWHIDRFVRLARELESVIDLEVDVHAVKSGHVDLSNPAGRAVARTVTAWSQYEGEQKAERQKAASRQRAREGKSWWPRRPFGLELDGTLRLPEAQALRRTYKGLLLGRTLRSLALELNSAGHLTNRGNPWTAMSLRAVLLNPRNAGIKTYEGEEVGRGAWKAIVTEDVFRATVRLLNDDARKSGGGGRRTYLLSGVAVCDKCQGPVTGAWRGRSGSPDSYLVYVCRATSCVSHRALWVDQFVVATVAARLDRPDAEQIWLDDSGPNAADLRVEAVTLRERLDAMAEDYGSGLLTRSQLLSGSEAARERLAAVENAMSGTGASTALQGLVGVKDVRGAWDKMAREGEVDRMRTAIQAVLAGVALRPRGRGVREMHRRDVGLTWRGRWAEGSAPDEAD